MPTEPGKLARTSDSTFWPRVIPTSGGLALEPRIGSAPRGPTLGRRPPWRDLLLHRNEEEIHHSSAHECPFWQSIFSSVIL